MAGTDVWRQLRKDVLYYIVAGVSVNLKPSLMRTGIYVLPGVLFFADGGRWLRVLGALALRRKKVASETSRCYKKSNRTKLVSLGGGG
jgi:hypothetical protein